MYATFLFDLSQLSLVSPVPLVTANKHCPKPSHGQSGHVGVNTPVTIAECFEDLAGLTRQRMRSSAGRGLQTPAEFAQRQSANGKFTLTAAAWQFELGSSQCQLRMVKIGGAKSNIINTWIFPADPRSTPVFAAELIGVGQVVRVAFVDIQTPLASAQSESLNLQLKSIADAYVQLPCDEAAPDWATDASVGHYTYARNIPEQQVRAIQSCYLDYLDLYLNNATFNHTLSDSKLSISSARETLHAYQLHHMQHSPGKKFLGNLFGIEWTERFMLDFLFTLP